MQIKEKLKTKTKRQSFNSSEVCNRWPNEHDKPKLEAEQRTSARTVISLPHMTRVLDAFRLVYSIFDIASLSLGFSSGIESSKQNWLATASLLEINFTSAKMIRLELN